MPTGFMSERTAEYVLVPDIVQRFGNSFSRVVPFFYWTSREGSARVLDGCEANVRLIAAYARRPKVNYIGQSTITMKINSFLFRHASILRSFNIPVFAGVPCVSNLGQHSLGAHCAWFLLDGGPYEMEDSFFEIGIEGPTPVLAGYHGTPVLGPLSPEELLKVVLERCETMPWSEAFRRIGDASRTLAGEGSSYRSAWFGRFIPYKPFYLALLGDNVHPECAAMRRKR